MDEEQLRKLKSDAGVEEELILKNKHSSVAPTKIGQVDEDEGVDDFDDFDLPEDEG